MDPGQGGLMKLQWRRLHPWAKENILFRGDYLVATVAYYDSGGYWKLDLRGHPEAGTLDQVYDSEDVAMAAAEQAVAALIDRKLR